MSGKSKLFARLTSDHATLAELYAQEGRKDKAAETYAKAGDFARAARLAFESGDELRLVEYSLKGALGHVPEGYGEAAPLQAGELLARAGHHREAIDLFELAQVYRPAAESALKLNQPARAARYYEKARAYAEAAIFYQKANQLKDAVRALELESQRLQQDPRARTHPDALSQAVSQVNLQRAEILAKLGQSHEAAAALQGSAATPKSARLLESSGRLREAIEAYLQIGEPEQALRLVPRIPDLDRRLTIQVYRACKRFTEAGDLLAALGLAKDAAESYEMAGEWAKAASRWEAAREPLRAAGCYQKAGRPLDAARGFAAGGQAALAAAAYAQAGDRNQAAQCLLKAGQPIEAAEQLLAAGNRGGAARALIEVPATHPRLPEAVLKLAPLLVEEGLCEDALRRLRLVPLPPAGEALAERLYWEARALVGLSQPQEARTLYEQLLALRPQHRDAAKRLADLRASLEQTVLQAPPAALASTRIDRPAAGTALQLEVGQCLAERYDIQAELGRGGMGRVYKAYDRELREPVAIKTLLSQPGEGSGEEERLLREVQIARKIAHPNVVRVFDLGRFPGGFFVTMELLEGTRLDSLIDPRRQLPYGQIRNLLGEIAAGLQEAHRLGIVHRDLKPGNIILTSTRPKILDFGIARMAGFDTKLTQTGIAVGSPMYMSPEQLMGGELDGRSDLYALGILAYALIAGREPFQAPSPAALAMQHLQSPPPDPRQFRPDLPAPWLQLLSRLLAKQPAQRFGSAEEVIQTLEGLPG